MWDHGWAHISSNFAGFIAECCAVLLRPNLIGYTSGADARVVRLRLFRAIDILATIPSRCIREIAY